MTNTGAVPNAVYVVMHNIMNCVHQAGTPLLCCQHLIEETAMRSIHRLVTNIVLVLLLTSCGGNGSDSTGPVGNLPSADDLPSAGTINNPDANKGGADSVGSSTSGPVFGAGVQSNAMLRKSVNWTVEKSDPRIRGKRGG